MNLAVNNLLSRDDDEADDHDDSLEAYIPGGRSQYFTVILFSPRLGDTLRDYILP